MESPYFTIVLEADKAGNGRHSCYPAGETRGGGERREHEGGAIRNIKEAPAITLSETRNGTIAGDEVATRGGLPHSWSQPAADAANHPVSVMARI